jgi:hypothetical protein
MFEFPTSVWAERNGYGTLEKEYPHGAQARTFGVRQVQPFLRWILSLEGRAKVLEPAPLAAELRSLARDVLAVYEASGTSASGGGDD